MKKNFINKKKKNFININFYNILIIIIIIILFLFLNYNKIITFFFNIIEDYSQKYEYTLSEIDVSNLNYLKEEEILVYFKSYKRKSIFLIPIKKIANEISNNKWVKEISIKSNYLNSISVVINEEIPLGIYNNTNQKILFSNNLVVLDILKNNALYPNLITFFGTNSLNNSKKLLMSFENDFKSNIKLATFIENRRWNLSLYNGIVLKLPEYNIKDSINNYKKIYTNFSNKDLKEIKSIDLRILNKIIIRYKKDIND